jgi:amino acid adenylation domain-containing protein
VLIDLDEPVHSLVERRAAAAPGAPAIGSDRLRLTYGELNGRANRLAHLLLRLGVGPEVLVAVCADRSPELVVAELAVLKAGGAFLPLDPESPAERHRAILAAAGARIVLTRWDLAGRLPALADHVVVIEDERRVAGLPGSDPERPVWPDSLAYAIYTSGSTGRPKGVQVAHRGLANLTSFLVRMSSIGPADRTSMVANPSFDGSILDVWPYLVSGASIDVPDEETRLAPARLARWLLERGVTVTFLPTALAERVLDYAWPDAGGPRAMWVGGDRLHQVRQDLPFELINLYGPTEATVAVTWSPVRTGANGDRQPPIGRAIDGGRVHVVTPDLAPAAEGELCAGGAGVARGYIGRPDLTAERFVPDPFGGEPGGRLYRTGDVARRRDDGQLEFVGRSDRQVKIRGFRIELGEIEAALGEHPGVAEAAVEAAGPDGDDRRLVAYVVPAGPGSPEALLDDLRRRLPSYMVPAAVVWMAELPLTPAGKVDRGALPEPGPRSGGGAAPSSEMEVLTAGVWAELLPGAAPVDVDDNFFDLGGHSILGMQVVAQLSEALDIEVPLRLLFDAPTVASLAARLTEMKAGTG